MENDKAQISPTGPYDPGRCSWVESANSAQTDFPIQNLPFGVFSLDGGKPRGGIAIGDEVLDIASALDAGHFRGRAAEAAEVARGGSLNALLELDAAYPRELRLQTAELLDRKSEHADAVSRRADRILHRLAAVTMHLPVAVKNYTDFFAGIHHARAAGALMHKDGDVLPANYKWVPIAYHGRASSVQVSGEEIRRPKGQIFDGGVPKFAASRYLDLELELGCIVARGNVIGAPIPIREAGQHIFGMCLLNDWSARDIQRWEMQPLGPFLGKNFGTSISPWIVTMDALAPFRVPAMAREAEDPKPLDHLWDEHDQQYGGLDIDLAVLLQSERMRSEGEGPHTIIRSNARYLYWTLAQMIAHHTSGGCNLLSGDLVGTGTISGPQRDQLSSLLELTFGGKQPFTLPNGEERRFLEDQDEVIFRARCNRPGFASIGFGECVGRIAPARD